MDGGLADIIEKKAPKRQTPITPPGSQSARNMQQHCTACQLCVSACPNDVLRPSQSLDTFMQPTLSYERGYCRPECTKCSEVCPAGAILKIDKAENHPYKSVMLYGLRKTVFHLQTNKNAATAPVTVRQKPYP